MFYILTMNELILLFYLITVISYIMLNFLNEHVIKGLSQWKSLRSRSVFLFGKALTEYTFRTIIIFHILLRQVTNCFRFFLSFNISFCFQGLDVGLILFPVYIVISVNVQIGVVL